MQAFVSQHPKFPGIGKMVVSAVTSVAKFSGFASDAIQEARLAVCRACPKWDAEQQRCTLCGCYTALKVKSRAESCPDNPSRWGAEPLTPPPLP